MINKMPSKYTDATVIRPCPGKVWVFLTKFSTPVLKGTNCLTEMYSAIAADVPIESDKSTQKNPVMMRHLTSAKSVRSYYFVILLDNMIMYY